MQNVLSQAQDTISIQTSGQGLYELTREVVDWTQEQGFEIGQLTLYCRHTSASSLIPVSYTHLTLPTTPYV